MRRVLEKDGIYFYLHVDAAYGGYGRAIFLDEDNNFIPFEDLKDVHYKYNVFTENKDYILEEVHSAYKAIEEAESVTIDPHKMGYVPYSRLWYRHQRYPHERRYLLLRNICI